MSATPGKDYKKYRWFWFFLQTTIGLLLLICTYMMYKGMLREDEIVKHSPVVRMKVTGRERGAGTGNFPDIIHTKYQGRSYKFECGRKYFRSTFELDSIPVHYDANNDMAALPKLNFPHYTFLLILIAGGGILTVGDAIVTLRKYS